MARATRRAADAAVGRRQFLQLGVGFSVAIAGFLATTRARAFGDGGAFDPRGLVTGATTAPLRATAAARWGAELVQRTSAPARSKPSTVRADSSDLATAPFAFWSAREAPAALSAEEISGLRRWFGLGGTLLVDDGGAEESAEAGESAFLAGAKREILRVLTDGAPIAVPAEHVLYKSYYLLDKPEGRVARKKPAEAIFRNGKIAVLFVPQDLLGALARSATGTWEQSVTPGGETQRERAIRFAVNIAMYVLCSNYKDDQVHAPFLMRRRAAE